MKVQRLGLVILASMVEDENPTNTDSQWYFWFLWNIYYKNQSMNKNIIEILQESIVSIYDEFDNIIEYSQLELIL